jgi:hypothetical protein
VEDKDVSWVSDASLKFLTETNGIGSFGDAGCGCVVAVVQEGPLVGRGGAVWGTLLHLAGLLVHSARPIGGSPDQLVHSPNVLWRGRPERRQSGEGAPSL